VFANHQQKRCFNFYEGELLGQYFWRRIGRRRFSCGDYGHGYYSPSWKNRSTRNSTSCKQVEAIRKHKNAVVEMRVVGNGMGEMKHCTLRDDTDRKRAEMLWLYDRATWQL